MRNQLVARKRPRSEWPCSKRVASIASNEVLSPGYHVHLQGSRWAASVLRVMTFASSSGLSTFSAVSCESKLVKPHESTQLHHTWRAEVSSTQIPCGNTPWRSTHEDRKKRAQKQKKRCAGAVWYASGCDVTGGAGPSQPTITQPKQKKRMCVWVCCVWLWVCGAWMCGVRCVGAWCVGVLVWVCGCGCVGCGVWVCGAWCVGVGVGVGVCVGVDFLCVFCLLFSVFLSFFIKFFMFWFFVFRFEVLGFLDF